MPKSRRSAALIVAAFERAVEDAAMRGAGHPDLMGWHLDRLAVARERLIRYLMGQPVADLRMPPQPEVEY